MKHFFLITLFFYPFFVFGQFDYELLLGFKERADKNRKNNLKQCTELKFIQEENKWVKKQAVQFNNIGMPTVIKEFTNEGDVTERKQFHYKDTFISKIETYKNGRLIKTTEFEHNNKGKIASYTDYVHRFGTDRKVFVWKTIMKYHSNNEISKKIKLRGYNRDTVKTIIYDRTGRKVKAYTEQSMHKEFKILYKWNGNKTLLNEIKFKNDSTPYDTVVHRFNNKFQKTKRVDDQREYYWKYNDKGQLVETNKELFYKATYKYSKNGYKKKKIMNLLEEPNSRDFPEQIRFKYKYEYYN